MTSTAPAPESLLGKTTLMIASALAALLLVSAAQSAQAQTYTVLYSFTGKADGTNPDSPLIRNSQGDLFGTTEWGGHVGPGYGVFFKLSSNGTESVLHTFENTDGKNPIGQ